MNPQAAVEFPARWDRQPNEPGRAYEAFRVFLELGPERSTRDAFQHWSGTKAALQPSGLFKSWVKDHDWKNRALAYDNHASAVAQRAIDRVTDETAEKWARRLQSSAEADWLIAEDLRAKVKVWAKMPPVQRTVTGADGKSVTILEPVGIKDTKDVAAIAQALPDAHVDLDPKTATAEQLQEAIARLEAAKGIVPSAPRIARTD